MMPAAKHFDPVLGVDIHIIQPPGPVPPIPVPHPFVGFLFDAFDYAPIIGATVMVNGVPRAIAGTQGRTVPGVHFPIGGMFVKPPANECEMFMGSSTVDFDGDAASYMALPALSCQCIGMVAPFRRKKKGKIKSLVAPFSVVLPIPTGPPVTIGGPPTISLMAIGMKLGMAGLGRLGRGLRRLQRGTGRVGRAMRRVSASLRRAASTVMDKLGVPPSVRNRVNRAICSVTGHPVDVATGKVFTERVDFELPGPIPFRWNRVWYSTSVYTGPLGNGWHHEFDMALLEDPANNVLALRMGDGRPVAFPMLRPGESSFNRQERYELFRDERGYGLLALNHLTYRFSAVPADPLYHVLTSIENRSNDQIQFRYDTNGTLTTIIDSGGRVLLVEHDERRRISAIHGPDPDGATAGVVLVAYRYDMAGELVEATDALGHPVRYQYRDRLLIRETNAAGLSFYFEYDSVGPEARCTRTWGDGGIFEHRMEYLPEQRITRVTDSLGAVTTSLWDERGVVLSETGPDGATVSAAYGDDCEILQDTDPLGNVMAYEYDERRNPVQIVFGDGGALKMKYDKFDNLCEAWDAAGGHWQWKYDNAGLMVEQISPLGHTTAFERQGGRIVKTTGPGRAEVRYEYDSAGNVTAAHAPEGLSMRWVYDALGRAVRIEDARGNVVERKFDLKGRLTHLEEPGGAVRQFAYDGEGNLLFEGDGAVAHSYRYTGLNRLAMWAHASGNVQYTFDTEGRLVEIKNEAGLSYRYELDGSGNVISETDFDGRKTRYIRDQAGRIIETITPDGASRRYRRDAAGRVVAAEYPDGERDEYKYNAEGLLIEANNSVARVKLERDAWGRIAKETQGRYTIEYNYDETGLTAGYLSSLGTEVEIRRDSRTFVRSARIRHGAISAAFSWERDVQGYKRQGQFPRGFMRIVWNTQGLPVREEAAGWSPVQPDKQYQWDTTGRIRSLLSRHGGLASFQYDPDGNLAAMQEPGGPTQFRAHDPVRNIYGTESHLDRTYGPAGELLEMREEAGSTFFTYDNCGNLIQKDGPGGRWEFAWSGGGWLSEVRRPDGETVRFAYDALGRRVLKQTSTSTTRWVWSLNNPLHEWTVPNMADTDKPDRRSLITWIFEPGRWAPLAKLDGQECFSVLTDFRGVPLAAANTRGHIVWSGDTDLYGRLEIFTGEKSLIPFRLAGQYEDTETGLYYNRFRYYDPWTGVFLSRDPTRLKYGIRRYAFVNDPILMADPLGLHEVYAWIRDEAGQTTPVPGPTRNGTWRSTRRGPHSEEHLINHLETHPDVPGNTVVIQSIGQPRMDDARNLSTLPPCGPEARNCDQALEDFAHRRGCNVEYHWVDREGVPQVQHYPRPCA